MNINVSPYEAALTGAVMKLYQIATHNDPANELYGDVTPSEHELIMAYSAAKGLSSEDRKRIEQLYLNPDSKKILEDICLADKLLLNKDHLAENQLSFETIAKFARGAFKDNLRLDPEEFKLLETMLEIENLMTPKHLDRLYELTKKYNLDKKLNLWIREPEEIEHYKKEFEKAGFHISSYIEKDGKMELEDYNEKGNMNMIIFSPHNYPEKQRNRIISGFKKSRKQEVLTLPPILAIATKEGDTPFNLGVDRTLGIGAEMQAIIENINELYHLRYIRKIKNGK
ncbi:MAG: hypothetical protein KJ623_03690 [Nanoarchaeota archaeon]|nr:hypothetical protein [Nanoarchaeota archaeon]MBU0962369.1 hypothetical protein [Nanoarchaeota archaeon]